MLGSWTIVVLVYRKSEIEMFAGPKVRLVVLIHRGNICFGVIQVAAGESHCV